MEGARRLGLSPMGSVIPLGVAAPSTPAGSW